MTFFSHIKWLQNLVGKHLLILQKNAISWKLCFHHIMHGGHYSYCKEKWKEKWAWTKESCFVGLWMILNIFLFSNIKNLIGTKNKTFLICRLMNFNSICSRSDLWCQRISLAFLIRAFLIKIRSFGLDDFCHQFFPFWPTMKRNLEITTFNF